MKKFVFILVILAAINGIVLSERYWNFPPQGDGLHYSNVAASLSSDGSFSESGKPTARRDPGYVFFLSGVYKIFGVNYAVVRVFQILFFCGISVLIYFLTREIFFDERLAKTAALLTALFYPLASYAGLFFTELLFTFIFLISIFCFLRGYKSQRKIFFVISGLCLGYAILTKSYLIYFPFFFLAIFLYSHRASMKKFALHLAIFSVCVALVVVPWTVRNKAQFGSFTVSQKEGPVLFFAIQRLKIRTGDLPKVLVANILGDFFAQRIFGSYNRQEVEEGDFGTKLTELSNQGLGEQQINAELSKISKKEIRTHPLRYLLVVVPIEFLKLHTPIFPFESAQGLFSDESRHQNIPETAKALVILTVRTIYWLFFALVIYGIIKSRSYNRELVFVYTAMFYTIGVYSLLHGIPRYLLPIYPLYIIFFSYGILAYINQRKETRIV
ncbi:MAG: hypothetical protein A2826_00050 [Candidatus Doudnabacteria bacterium RIFCSPHIGHO2_01_FULL_43_23]|uniref:Glycosyltransferase RgtA/B/C/D-like domain-containing protein n=1 Tax=Candidatus Doudnabacteria bacterium RIFCSPHIGHO2_01_FULL_43_23 TaxID=1817822 RepID=A0A1F5NQN0_9BACT|nr:MAG: hypothetical protein A2826_00050 [Candidatus Doudnabacteria bacterium RIFCSPHIGHO2_01_FULL_43_23]